jgi:hypothetical protein
MKALLIIYRLLTFILLPIAAILGFLDISLLLLALANPAALFPVFAIACIVIYIFTSFSFLVKGVLGGKECKHSLRDWIRVNAFVSIAFSALGIIEYITLVKNKTIAGEVIQQAVNQQTIPQGMTAGQLEQLLLKFLFIFFIFSIVLIFHILMSLRLLKQFSYLFK